jgi:transcriptional regulator with XRE-family HTH domain
MHNERIKAEDIASELGVTAAYISMILNGKRNPPGAKERIEQAVNAIIEKRKSTTQAGEG